MLFVSQMEADLVFDVCQYQFPLIVDGAENKV